MARGNLGCFPFSSPSVLHSCVEKGGAKLRRLGDVGVFRTVAVSPKTHGPEPTVKRRLLLPPSASGMGAELAVAPAMKCPSAAMSTALFASTLRALPRLGCMLAPGVVLRAFSVGARSLQGSKNSVSRRPRVPRRTAVPCYSRAEIVVPIASENSSSGSLSASGCYEYNRLLPCPLQNRPPRVEHLVVSEGGPVLEYICKELELPHLYVNDLIHFGAVYYALVCPTPPPTATPEQIEVFKNVTAPSVLKKRASIKGKTVREAQKTYRITHPDEFVEAGTYLRVHVHPKRFPRCYEVDWKSRIIAVADTYVVLDKPAATSVGGTTDNIEESCATFASRALELNNPLLTTHQIDNCTEGCVVLAKTKDFCSYFHGLIREKKVSKFYLALAAAPVPTGIISHYMRPVNVAPRVVSEDFIAGWHLCQLEVLECKEVAWPNADVECKNSIENCGWTSKDVAYECKINLLTGKTHQVRAQLAAIGAPIVGDSMYMPAAIAEMENPHNNPFGRGKKNYLNEDDKTNAMREWIAKHGKEPSAAIGLQAFQISWNDGNSTYNAGPPWWRLGNS